MMAKQGSNSELFAHENNALTANKDNNLFVLVNFQMALTNNDSYYKLYGKI